MDDAKPVTPTGAAKIAGDADSHEDALDIL
jgi:hypothetical protein